MKKISFVLNGNQDDVYGNPIDSTSFGVYTGGAFAARIFTVTSPYAEADLEWLKFTQSADVMSICCLNQTTLTVYQPYDLTRHSDTNWTFKAATPAPSISQPAVTGITATGPGALVPRGYSSSWNPGVVTLPRTRAGIFILTS